MVTYRSDYERDSVANTILEYIYKVPHRNVEWLSVAAAYCSIKDYKSAYDAVEMYKMYTNERPTRMYSILSEIYENFNDYEKSLKCYKKYFLHSDSLSLLQIREDTRFLEERHALETKNTQQQNLRRLILLASVSFILMLVLIIVLIRQKLKSSLLEKRLVEAEKERLAHSYSLLEEEVSSLKELLDSNMLLDKSITDIIKERIDLLNQLFISRIRDEKELWRKIDTIIEDREEFMHSLLLVYKSTHPRFISHLKERNLTEMEMEYCCLFAIGMNGKDIGFYTNQSRHYHISSSIREKLKMDLHTTTLKNYISLLLAKE